MKKIVHTAIVIVLTTALIGTLHWASNGSAKVAEDAATTSSLQAINRFPLFWAGISALITTMLISAKRRQLIGHGGKASRISTIGVLTPAIACLIAQICIPLLDNEFIERASVHLVFFYFITGFLLIMGNYLVTVPFESPIGFRTKATLSDATVWVRTHRAFGHNLVVVALICLPLPFILEGRLSMWSLLGIVATTQLIAWFHARQLAARLKISGATQN